uniref:Uncharacterized protein n=1 Tax=Panagrolaimus sp. ES5 TaxID=591445 RepID=A0AC34GJW7_9BILA
MPKTKMNKTQEANMIRAAQRTPLVLMDEIAVQKNLAGMINNNVYVSAAQMKVADDMNSVSAQVVKAPLIVFKQNAKSVTFAEWDLREVQFVAPATINAFIVFFHRINRQDAQRFVQMVVGRAREVGMTLGGYDYEEINDDQCLDKNSIEKRILYHRDTNGVDFVLAVVAGTPFHHILK